MTIINNLTPVYPPKKSTAVQLVVMENWNNKSKPGKAVWCKRTEWKGHGWFKMKVFQYCHGAGSHGWPIGKKEPSRLIANKRLNARESRFPWQTWDTL